MSHGAAFLGGLVAGVVLGIILGPAAEGPCCKKINSSVTDELRDRFGEGFTNATGAVGLNDRWAGVLGKLGLLS